jgi:hypothetical protein
MPSGIVKEMMPASANTVFDLIHDYDRRLEWDSLLREAYVEPPFERAEKGAVTMCRGKWLVGGISFQTVYVSFERGKVAAVKMTNRPPFFDTFAASIRHFDAGNGNSIVSYHFRFTARPRTLRPLLEPVMLLLLTIETRKRLLSLKNTLKKSAATE